MSTIQHRVNTLTYSYMHYVNVCLHMEHVHAHSERSEVGYISCSQQHITSYIFHQIIQMLHCFTPAHLLISKPTNQLQHTHTHTWF